MAAPPPQPIFQIMPIRKSGSLDAAYLNNSGVDEEDLEDIANMLMELPPTLRQLRGSVTADTAAETAGGSSVLLMDDDASDFTQYLNTRRVSVCP